MPEENEREIRTRMLETEGKMQDLQQQMTSVAGRMGSYDPAAPVTPQAPVNNDPLGIRR
jgi:hypothetical protein